MSIQNILYYLLYYRDEVNAVLSNQRELVTAARDIKNFVADVHNKVSDEFTTLLLS